MKRTQTRAKKEIDDLSVPRIVKAVVYKKETNNSVYVLCLKTGGEFTIDKTAADLWNLIDGRRSFSSIVKRLKTKHGSAIATPSTCKKLVKKLVAANLIELH